MIVARLEISMNNAVAMRLIECVCDFDGIAQSLIERQRTFRQPVGKRLTLQLLHHQEIHPFLVADIVKGADVRMIQAGNGVRLTFEPFTHVWITGEMIWKDLYRDGAIEARIFSAIDLAHAAGANGGDDLIRAQSS